MSNKTFLPIEEADVSGNTGWQAALEIAHEHENILLQLRDALDRDDYIEAKRLIKHLVPDRSP